MTSNHVVLISDRISSEKKIFVLHTFPTKPRMQFISRMACLIKWKKVVLTSDVTAVDLYLVNQIGKNLWHLFRGIQICKSSKYLSQGLTENIWYKDVFCL